MANTNTMPQVPFLQANGLPSPAWILWLTNPQFATIDLSNPVAVTSGGTGLTANPGVGQILVGTGGAYALVATLPDSAFPALGGDVSTPLGDTTTTLATVNATPGSYGNGQNVSTFTVNGKGLVTVSSSTPITGSSGTFTVATAFGCNGKTAQTSAAVNAAIASSAGATYTATEQTMLNDLKALVNQLRAALVANGVAI